MQGALRIGYCKEFECIVTVGCKSSLEREDLFTFCNSVRRNGSIVCFVVVRFYVVDVIGEREISRRIYSVEFFSSKVVKTFRYAEYSVLVSGVCTKSAYSNHIVVIVHNAVCLKRITVGCAAGIFDFVYLIFYLSVCKAKYAKVDERNIARSCKRFCRNFYAVCRCDCVYEAMEIFSAFHTVSGRILSVGNAAFVRKCSNFGDEVAVFVEDLNVGVNFFSGIEADVKRSLRSFVVESRNKVIWVSAVFIVCNVCAIRNFLTLNVGVLNSCNGCIVIYFNVASVGVTKRNRDAAKSFACNGSVFAVSVNQFLRDRNDVCDFIGRESNNDLFDVSAKVGVEGVCHIFFDEVFGKCNNRTVTDSDTEVVFENRIDKTAYKRRNENVFKTEVCDRDCLRVYKV